MPRRFSCAPRMMFLVGTLAVVGGCQGSIAGGEPQEDSPPETKAPRAKLPAAAAVDGAAGGAGNPAPTLRDDSCSAAAPSPSPLLKLSSMQYRNTVTDLLASSGVAPVTAEIKGLLSAVPEDTTATFKGLDNRISLNHLTAYFNVASGVADAITSQPDRLVALAGACAKTQPLPASCLDGFLTGFGRRALRRPPTTEELASYRQLNDGTRTNSELFRALILNLLTSPRFVNHLEIDGQAAPGHDDDLALSPYEIASRLSYHFWQTMPDEALFAAAADGTIATDAGYRRQVDRLFGDPRTRETLWQFWYEWLRLEAFLGFQSDRPAFKAQASGENINAPGKSHYLDMVQEIRGLTELYTFGRTGTLSDLLTSDLSVTTSSDLAHLYNVPAWDGKGDYPRFAAGTRPGLLTRAALLVSSEEQTNPFHRGALVRRNLLCDPLPQPDPATLPPGSLDPPPPDPTATTRERFSKKMTSLCTGCHNLFNDLGFAMESYDFLGRSRMTEKIYDPQNGKFLAERPLDLQVVPRVDLADERPTQGIAELTQRLVESKKVEDCLARNYFQFAVRHVDGSADACALNDLRAGLAGTAGGLANTFKRIALQPNFRRRKVGAP